MFGVAILSIPLSVTTAILVFARPVALDASRKHLSAHTDTNRRALHLLNERVRQTARKTGLPILFSTDLIVHSGSFGEQLSEAIQAVFEQKFEQVLVIGNDCPALTTADLNQAAAELEAGRVVLGPDNRGGAYLLGLSRIQFDAEVLRELPWQTNQLHRVICAQFAAHTVLPLRALSDINQTADIQAYWTDFDSAKSFIGQLLRLLNGWVNFCSRVIVRRAVQPNVYRTGPLRAPPFSAYLLHCR